MYMSPVEPTDPRQFQNPIQTRGKPHEPLPISQTPFVMMENRPTIVRFPVNEVVCPVTDSEALSKCIANLTGQRTEHKRPSTD